MAEQVDNVSITILVEKGKNKVLYAEAGNDFVEVLFSFLALPLGTISRLISAKESNIERLPFGSISSLYKSVYKLDEQYLWSKTCKDMLLSPKNSMESWQNIKLNIDDTGPMKSYFLCKKEHCSVENRVCVSYFRNQKCKCGKLLNREKLRNLKKYGFVKDTSTFIVSDDLFVMPNLIGTSLNLLQKHGINDLDTIDKQTINISKKEVVDLLKLSFFSKTPLQFELRSQILPICKNNYKENFKSYNFVDPKSPISGGYVNGGITFMVTDDLDVTPMSSIDGISYLEKMKVPIDDVEEIVINIGQREGLSILKASLTSTTSVLTNSLNQYIGSRAAQPDLSSNASLKDWPLKKSSLSLLRFIYFICYPFKRKIDANED
ncbi:hypothetical protein QL285_086178 [Trifolium repens]|nr:hypothetical protein QL285_086178 [Trifolium repens]